MFENSILSRVEKVIPLLGDHQIKIDYDTRTDGQPVYVGMAEKGIATATERWVIAKLTYDASDFVTTVQHSEGAWDSRASLAYA